MRKERLKNEKHFPFFSYLFAHSFLMIVYILSKTFKVCWKTPPIEKPHSAETYQSTCITSQFTGFHLR